MTAVVLGVSGGIAAYKAAELLRLFTESGHGVRVVPTRSSLNFVGAATWEALSGLPAHADVFDDVPGVPHVRIGQSADLVVVAPATADLLARAAHGLADDLLTNTLLTARCPIVLAPAMHTEMWEHPATKDNVATLRRRGIVVLEPAVGRLTGADSGAGRLPDPEQIFQACLAVLRAGTPGRTGVAPGDLSGRRVLVSAGGTREYLDPVRFLGNRSSGRQGVAIAEAAASRGAQVCLVAANVGIDIAAGVDVIRVETTAQLSDEMIARSADVDAVVMAAAPADFRPAETRTTKIKKTAEHSTPELALVENPDILVELASLRTRKQPVLVGFAAETGDDAGSVLDHGRTKLERKGCDFLVVNDVSQGRAFDSPDNEAVILGSDGSVTDVPHGPKIALAHALWDVVVQRLDLA